MQFQRISPSEVLVLAPLETAREAAWYALRNAEVDSPIIDPVKNVVFGVRESGKRLAAHTATASFMSVHEGTVVSFQSKSLLTGPLDFKNSGLRVQQMADALERLLQQGYTPQAIK